MKPLNLLLAFLLGTVLAFGQDTNPDPARELESRARYETVLLRNPFQERAFNSVYESYGRVEGVDAWVEKLIPQSREGDGRPAALLLLGQIYDRQFKTGDAITALEQAVASGESRPQFKVLLGTLYYKVGKDEAAGRLLGESLDALTDLDQRSAVSRLLGNLYLRQGKRDEAVAVWKRITEQNPGEAFAQLELAEIYEDNRMWDQAIEVYQGLVAAAKDDPYQRCRALRSIGDCQVQSEKFKEAIATYEQALGLVAPGNWLFEDLKLRLVGVYEDIGDLEGLRKYVEARLQQDATDIEFRDLLAETLIRLGQLEAAEKQYLEILERSPRNGGMQEKLLALYQRMNSKDAVVAAYEKLITLFPTDTDYLRRLGEFYLRDSRPDQAKETWRRLAKGTPKAEDLGTLAGWFEGFEFPDEAIETYQQALALKPNRDWTERLAALRFQKGEEAEAVRLWMTLATPESSPEDLAGVASILESHNRLAEALQVRDQAVKKAPDDLEQRLGLAKVLLKQQKFSEAAVAFEILASQNTNEFLSLQGEQGRLDAWRELGVLEEKQKSLEAEVDAQPTDLAKLGQLARLYERSGQREKAVELYEARRTKDPENLEYLRAIAPLYETAKMIDEALAAYQALLTQDRTRARVYQQNLLTLYLAADQKDDAIRAAEALVSLAPGDPETRLSLAQVYLTYRQPDKALAEFRTALRLEPNEPEYYRQYGEVLESEKRYGEAHEAFRKMLDVAKEDTTRIAAVTALTRIHVLQSRLDDLVAEFQRRIRNTPKKLAAYEELAVIYRESGQVSRGVEILESGLNTVDDKNAALRVLIRASFEAQDFPKVKSYFEQLIAGSGKPTPNEFERLGQIYAQLGEIEKARQVWSRIVTESPKDPKAHDRLAQILRDAGLTDEALAMKTRAVELDPTDLRRRFELAQMLAQAEQPVDAIQQLNLILEQGALQQEQRETASSEKKVKPLNRGAAGGINPAQFMYGMASYRGGYYGGGWQGSFQQFRPQLIALMANIAQQSIGEDALVEQFTARAGKSPGSREAQQDLIAILQIYNRAPEALKVSEALLTRYPKDPELLQQVALFHQSQQQVDQAIPLLERLAEVQPKQGNQALQSLVPLYFQNKQEDKALALLDQLLQERPKDLSTVWAMAGFLQQQGKRDRARMVYTNALNIDPAMRGNLLNQLAQLELQDGRPEVARTLYIEMLTMPSPNAVRLASVGGRRQTTLYSPPPPMANRGPMFIGGLRRAPQNVFGYIDYSRQNALTQLKMLDKRSGDAAGATNFVDQLEQVARGYSSASSASARVQAWDTGKLLISFYLSEKSTNQAADLLMFYRDAGYDEIEWFNVALYVAELNEDFESMIGLYDAVQGRYPAKSREVSQAKAMTWVRAKNYEAAAKVIRDMNQQRVPPAQVLAMIRALRAGGEKKVARELLEEHLAGASRNPDALQELAQLYGEENEFAKAIALATEAWERKAHGRSNSSYYYSPGMYYPGSFGQGNSLLDDLFRYYVAERRSEEIIAQFRERLDKQPSSVAAHENLAQLYRLAEKRAEALEVYQALAAKRPHLNQIRQAIANLYVEMGDTQRATEYYEQLIKANPLSYQQFQWELRMLYQRMGRGKELGQMEEQMAAKARDPNQIREVADRLKEQGDFEKAAEMYRKAIKMSPGDPWMRNQLADVFVSMGKYDDAVSMYLEWMDSPQMRTQSWVDHHTMMRLVGLFRATDRLGELKERAAAALAKNPTDRTAIALQVHIALFEKRIPDALAGFRTLSEGQGDPNGMWQLMEIAAITGDYSPVLELIEKANPDNVDQMQLAQFYATRGNLQKAEDMVVKFVERQTSFGNGGWVVRQGADLLGSVGSWDAAERLVRRFRDSATQPWEREQIDSGIAEKFIQSNRYGSLIDEILAKDAIKGRDLDLLKSILQQYQWRSQPERRQAFLERICRADPKNRDLQYELATSYDLETQGEQRLAILERLVAEDPNNLNYQEQRARCLIALGRVGEAIETFQKWAQEKPLEARWLALSRLMQASGRLTDSRKALVQALETADPSRKDDLRVQLAAFDTALSGGTAQRDAVRQIFDTKKDQQSFYACLSVLINQGFVDEAHALFLAHKDGGYLEQYQGDNVMNVCLDRGDLQSPLDLTWRFVRYGEAWNRDQSFFQATGLYLKRGKFPAFAAGLDRLVQAETNQNALLQRKVVDAWLRAGDTAKALEQYQTLLRSRPFDRSAKLAYAQLLVAQGQADDAVALVRDTRGTLSLGEDINAQFELMNLWIQLGRTNEVQAHLDNLLAWSKGGNTLERAGDIQRQLKNWSKAAEYYEASRKVMRSYNDADVLRRLGQCYAKLNRNADALGAWSSLDVGVSDERAYLTRPLEDWLLTEGLNELALQWAEHRLQQVPGSPRSHLLMARAHWALGRTNEVLAVVKRASEQVPAPLQSQWRVGFCQMVRQQGAEDLLWERHKATPDPALAGILVTLAGRARPDEVNAARLKDLATLAPADPTDRVVLGRMLARAKETDAAVAQFRSALASTNTTAQRDGIKELAALGHAAEVTPVALDWVRRRPQVFVEDLPLGVAAAKTRDPAVIGALDAAWKAAAIGEGQQLAYALLLDYGRGQTNDFTARLAAVTTTPGVTITQLETLATLCAHAGQRDARLKLLQRLASPGHPRSTRHRALTEWAKASAVSGDLAGTFQAMAALDDGWGQEYGAEAREAVAESITAESIPQLKDAVVKALQGRIHHDVASQLVGLASELAERAGQSLPAAELASGAGLDGLELEEARAWDDLIETWEVCGPWAAASDNESQSMALSQDGLLGRRADGQPTAPEFGPHTVWRRTDPRHELGAIRLAPLLGLSTAESEGQYAYARTVVNSPDDRVVTLALGSDDTAAVWVNGRREFVANMPRSLALDQDRFPVRLKKGPNEVLLRIGNGTDSWAFCLRVVAGREGLTLAQGGQ